MELLNRYLEAVRKYLPWQRQDDIVAELRANLEAQLEDKQEALGRSLNEAEVKAWASQLPRPSLMAGRYRRQQYLIGPELFPMYSLILRMVMFWLAIVLVGVNMVKALVHPPASASIGTAIAAGIVHVGFVLAVYAAALTLVFAAIEYMLLHHPESFPWIAARVRTWDVSALPPMQPLNGDRPRTLPHAIADLIGQLALLGWLLLLPKNPFLILGPGASAVYALPYTLAPVIVNAYWAIVALTAVQVAWKAIDLQTGAWRGERKIQHAVHRLLGFIPLLILLMASGNLWVVLKNPAADFAKYGPKLGQINRAIYLGVRLVLAITVIAFAAEWVQGWYHGYKRRVASAQ